TPPVGDQNAARMFFDRATLNSATGGTVVIVGEGFAPGETVTVSSCAAGGLTANADGGAAAFLTYAPAAGVSQCVLTGGTSGRVARHCPPARQRHKPSRPDRRSRPCESHRRNNPHRGDQAASK